MRTCVGCRLRADKGSLVRLVSVQQVVVVDPRQREPGRGAYLHPRPDGLATAVRRRSLSRALRLLVDKRVVVADQPLVTGPIVARLVEAWRAGAGPMVTATYGGRPGNPKLFDRQLLPDLLRLTGDTGARDLVAAHPDWVHRVEAGDLGSDADVDVEADLDRVGAMLTRETP